MRDGCDPLDLELAETLLDLARTHPAPGTRADLLAILVRVPLPESLLARLAVAMLDELSSAGAEVFPDLARTAVRTGDRAAVAWVRAFAATAGRRRHAALDALTEVRDPDAVVELRRLLRSPSERERRLAQHLLARYSPTCAGVVDGGGTGPDRLAQAAGGRAGQADAAGPADAAAEADPGLAGASVVGVGVGDASATVPATVADLTGHGRTPGETDGLSVEGAWAVAPAGPAAAAASGRGERGVPGHDGGSIPGTDGRHGGGVPVASNGAAGPSYHGMFTVLGPRWFDLLQQHPAVHATALPPARLGALLMERLLDSALAPVGGRAPGTDALGTAAPDDTAAVGPGRQRRRRSGDGREPGDTAGRGVANGAWHDGAVGDGGWPPEITAVTAVRLARELGGAYRPDRVALFRRYCQARSSQGPEDAVAAQSLAELAGVGSPTAAVRDLAWALCSTEVSRSSAAAAFVRTALEQASAARDATRSRVGGANHGRR